MCVSVPSEREAEIKAAYVETIFFLFDVETFFSFWCGKH